MNKTISAHAPLSIDVVSDVVCPWCYVGKRRLEQALALRADIPVIVRWRPFQLDGTIPAEGLDRKEYMARKFGSLERVAPVHQRLAEIGEEENIPFDFAAIARSPNTLDAHRLLRWALQADPQGSLQAKVKEALMRAYFVEGKDIGDTGVLSAIAQDAGMDGAEVSRRLSGDDDVEAVREEIAQAGRLGIQGVPFFIFGGTHAVSGAEAAEVLASAIDQALAHAEAGA